MSIKTLISAVLFFAVSILFFSSNALSQRNTQNYDEAITANPLALAFGLLNVNYEMQISKENSFTIGGTYYGFAGWTGIGIAGTYKWYVFQEQDKAISGFGFGPSATVSYFTYENSTWDSRMSLAIGGEASYKWVIDDFVIEPVLGINYNVLNKDGLDWRPFYIGVNLGYAW